MRMKKNYSSSIISLFIVFIVFNSLNVTAQIDELRKGQEARKKIFNSSSKNTNNFSKLSYVNPFIGTGGHGHTYPGATAPFGMMQLSPDTRFDGWDGCSGYHYSDSIIYGFSHTHLSGTGVSDYGDLLVVPMNGKPKVDPGYLTKKGYGSKFSHKQEDASPGFYSVKLWEEDISVRLTVTERAGMHEYTFNNKSGKKFILLDLDHRDKLLDQSFEIIDENTISGKRISKSWANEQHFYFHMETNVPFQKARKISNKGRNKLLLIFPKSTKQIILRVGMSAVDVTGAKNNLYTEIKHWAFDATHKIVRAKWSKELDKISFKTKDGEVMTNFYSALYHSFIAPNVFSDVDGRYRGMDGDIHELERSTDRMYTVFSLWDTYRATHPLYTITQVKKTNQFIQTFLNQYDQSGDLPVWELAGNETECMIGYHSASVISDAYSKGIRDYDAYKALNAMITTSQLNEHGKDEFQKNGYINSSNEPESVSKTLEYAYDEFCINQMINHLSKSKEQKVSSSNSELNQYNFINVFDPSVKFMRARKNGLWTSPFDPSEVNFNYTEANSWQYSLYAPHSVGILQDLIGGKKKFENWLDLLFTTNSKLEGRHQVDITGLIGQYAHGNEPSHHMAYLYNYTDSPEKTQEYTDQIFREMYSNKPDGLSGNEDCGQMSSWYVLSAMGIYQIAPGNPYYDFGRPLMDEVTIYLENKKKFKIIARNNSEKAMYIQSITLNGVNIDRKYISHEEIMAGGVLEFRMGPKINKEYRNYEHAPTLSAYPESFVPVPFFTNTSPVFEDSILADLSIVNPSKHQILYQIEKTGWQPFNEPFYISTNTQISAKGQTNKFESSLITQDFIKLDKTVTLKLNATYAEQYAAGGDNALIDGVHGKSEYRTGDWQGYSGEDFEAIITFDKPRIINSVQVGFLEDMNAWIFNPKEVSIEISTDGINYISQDKIIIDPTSKEKMTPNFNKINLKVESVQPILNVRIKALNFGVCPDWHLGAGGKTWMFLDEIVCE